MIAGANLPDVLIGFFNIGDLVMFRRGCLNYVLWNVPSIVSTYLRQERLFIVDDVLVPEHGEIMVAKNAVIVCKSGE